MCLIDSFMDNKKLDEHINTLFLPSFSGDTKQFLYFIAN